MKKAVLIFLSMLPFIAQAQITLVRGGKPVSRIVVRHNTGPDSLAAALLQDFVGRISGATLPIVEREHSAKGDVVISSNSARSQGNDPTKIARDGFYLSTENGMLQITGGSGKGAVYGVVTLLERYLGVQYWAANTYTLTPSRDVSLPALAFTENPAFSYRQIPVWSGREDPVYKLWHRLDTPQEIFAGSYWVHTFDKLLPSAVYGREHPEYYSYFRGKRNPGAASQWCLTNPEVLEIVAQRIDSVFKANPGKEIISVSQNDGNFTNCQCENCKAVDDYEGSPSGSLIHFMNKLAERFPDKQLSTLAYLYTMCPPKHVKPLPNVNIMLCSIDADREVPLTDNRSGRVFVEALQGWAAVSDNIFVWDYAINFDNYLSPFPNFHVLKPNMELFKANHATMHHCQMNALKGTNFGELRSYMAAKLIWNPEADADSLMQNFLEGYYGPAAPYLYQYIRIMEGALLGSGERLWIYDSPVTFKNGMLKPYLTERYEMLFDQAERAVAGDPELLSRVYTARLPLQYSRLEIARTEHGGDLARIEALLELFEKRVGELGVTALNERGNSPAEYCTLYRERFMPRRVPSLAAGASINFIEGPTGKYAELGKTALTDELYGGSTFVESWVGWEGKDASMVLDLGEKKQFTQVSTDFLHQLGAWILLPKQVVYSVSDDGKNFRTIGTYDLEEDRSPQVKYVAVEHKSTSSVTARYIKVDVKGMIDCPEWHYGVGHPCWFFVDEIAVY